MSTTPQDALKAELRKAARKLREAQRILAQLDRWEPDEDILDLLRELQGLAVLGRECYRTGRGVDVPGRELWLYEHGFKEPES